MLLPFPLFKHGQMCGSTDDRSPLVARQIKLHSFQKHCMCIQWHRLSILSSKQGSTVQIEQFPKTKLHVFSMATTSYFPSKQGSPIQIAQFPKTCTFNGLNLHASHSKKVSPVPPFCVYPPPFPVCCQDPPPMPPNNGENNGSRNHGATKCGTASVGRT
jgi:hypothetical protein